MKETEFDLSEKRIFIEEGDGKINFDGFWDYSEEDVKEFIRRNDEDLQKARNGEIMLEESISRIRKRAGDKLK